MERMIRSELLILSKYIAEKVIKDICGLRNNKYFIDEVITYLFSKSLM